MSGVRQSAPALPPQPGGPARTAPAEAAGSAGGFLARAAFLTALLTAAGSVLGLVRDQTIAHLYGAGPGTDAFLVAWTIPEVSATLLIEDAMALILVPAFSLALARRADPQPPAGPDPVLHLVRTTLPRLFLALGACSALLIATAPWVVALLAPGLDEPGLAVDCTRLTATCAFTYGLAGYCSAALRAHGSFVAPAAIYIASNVGIITTMLAVRGSGARDDGVRTAAAGVVIGGVLMVLIQLPELWRKLRKRQFAAPASRKALAAGSSVALGLIAPVIVFAAGRQSQVLIERFLAAPLPAGAISHLNYAQKVAQIPMTLSLMLCTVTFPVVARAMAAGETDRARRRVERDLALAAMMVLTGAALVISCAPQFIAVLFQRGEFTAADTAATADVMRVYALGLLGHTLVGALVRCYFSAARPLWFPALAMAAGLLLTAGAGLLLVQVWGVLGIAAANALGITLTAVLLLRGLGRHSVPVDIRAVTRGLLKLAAAAAAATGSGWLCGTLVPVPALGVTAACLVVPAVFLLLAHVLRAPETDTLLRPVSRKPAHAR
ncbi:murein biosynthesis integral membrane protein MurJ [Streptomyces sp. NPDC087850]|uniref:murein biosynthesis integral membrane protein MurJ n=1 Tax=Streptomyces sp. NPDC087850 TaxID=3365809 RepID=UPI00380C3CD7